MTFVEHPSIVENAAYLVGDISAVLIAISTITEFLPPIAAGLSIIYMFIRIWETCTVQNVVRRLKKEVTKPCKEDL